MLPASHPAQSKLDTAKEQKKKKKNGVSNSDNSTDLMQFVSAIKTTVYLRTREIATRFCGKLS